MRARWGWRLGAAAVALAAAAWWALGAVSPGSVREPELAGSVEAAPPQPPGPGEHVAGPAPVVPPPPTMGQPPLPGPAASPLDSMALPVFAADAQGRLVKDAHTRSGLERLVAMFEPAEALAKLRAQAAALPPTAERELEDLYHRYAQYTQAVATRLPAGEGEDPRALARQQLATLKALRREYFGAAPAQQMFGAEERAAEAMLAGPAGP